MGLTRIMVKLRNLGSANGTYEAEFLVDTGATGSLVPASELNRIGVQPVGRLLMNSQTEQCTIIASVWLRLVSWVKSQLEG